MGIEIKTLSELRTEFEDMAMNCMFGIKRLKCGEYNGTTF